MAQKLEELRVYQLAMDFWRSIKAILERPAYRKDRDLHRQTRDANDSIASNIPEGFEQGSDSLFVNYLCFSKGSLAEVVTRMRQAHLKGYLTEPELAERVMAAERLSRSLGAFIRYLDACGWKDRGRHKSRARLERRPRD
ncbi:MAG TPA: four helix bundle protein [Vicinamibacterales bacterium]|jgi:four helix bundle protein|nr:four helix bundle protein [Vicinamibacterales bacterium]